VRLGAGNLVPLALPWLAAVALYLRWRFTARLRRKFSPGTPIATGLVFVLLAYGLLLYAFGIYYTLGGGHS
jgi:hypothetical protein